MWLTDKFRKKDPSTVQFKDGIVVTKKEQPNLNEAGLQGTSGQNWDSFLGLGNFNPDDVGIATYKEMLKDSEVRAGFDLIRNSILSRNWRVSFPEVGSSSNNKEILEFLKFAFTHLDENALFEKSIGTLLYAIPFGFSVLEIVYGLIEVGRFSGKIGIRKLKDLDPAGIEFKTDKYGNLKGIIQNTGNTDKVVKIPLDRSIVYTIEKEFGNYYGISRLRSVFKNWFVKKTIIKFWNIALERFGMPILVGSVPSKQELGKMLTLLDNVQSRSSIAKTDGWSVDALETGVGRSAGGDYKDAIGYHNGQILKGLLVPPMLVAGQGGGGSYALSNTQFGLYRTMLKGIEIDISNIIEEKIIKPLVIYNYGVQDIYPQFVWEPMTKEDLLNLSKVFALLVKNGVVGADEQWMRDMMGVPHRDTAEITRDTVKDKEKDSGEVKNPPIPEVNIKQTRVQEEPKKGGSQQVKVASSPVAGKQAGKAGGDKTPV